jgi:hypothetical protein
LDSKPIHIASNFIGSGKLQSTERWDKKEKKFVDVQLPEVISLYNKSMGGVDLFDQYISYYR